MFVALPMWKRKTLLEYDSHVENGTNRKEKN